MKNNKKCVYVSRLVSPVHSRLAALLVVCSGGGDDQRL